ECGCLPTGNSSINDLTGTPSILSFPLLLAKTVTPTGFAFTPWRVSIAALIVSPILRMVSTISTFFPSTVEKLGFTAPATFFSPNRWGLTEATGFPSDLVSRHASLLQLKSLLCKLLQRSNRVSPFNKSKHHILVITCRNVFYVVVAAQTVEHIF